MICQECGKTLTNEEDCYGHDCEVKPVFSIDLAIRRVRNLLIKKAKEMGIYENFGQKEIRKLTDVYGYTSEIERLENWCINFDQKQLNTITK